MIERLYQLFMRFMDATTQHSTLHVALAWVYFAQGLHLLDKDTSALIVALLYTVLAAKH